MHTVYGGAHLFTAETPKKLGELALQSLDTYAPDARDVRRGARHSRRPRRRRSTSACATSCSARPVEDFRIDFEDGYGNRPDDEEDGHAAAAAQQVAAGVRRRHAAAVHRHPHQAADARARGALAAHARRVPDRAARRDRRPAAGELRRHAAEDPDRAPTSTRSSTTFDVLEDRLDLDAGTLRLEIMVETTQTIFDPQGRSMLPRLHRAAGGRLVAAHFGTYDYTANCDITAAHQKMRHPACDFAKHMMKVAFAGTGVRSPTARPTSCRSRRTRGADLTDDQKRDNRAAVFSAWRLHADDVRHSLVNGFYQGWDLHPAQLVPRYGAVYAFFLDGLAPASERLTNFVDKAAQATLVGDVFDDAATGQGLLNYFLRGIACGAVTEQEALATGLSLEEIRSKSFVKIMAGRRAKAS